MVDDGNRRLGILTDLGHVFAGLEAVIASFDAVLLESNYDPEMLADGPYPEWLKKHICRAGRGALECRGRRTSWDEASKRMKWACLGHLSQDTNTPELAMAHASADRRPASAAAGRHPARSHGCNRGVTMLGRVSENHVAE